MKICCWHTNKTQRLIKRTSGIRGTTLKIGGNFPAFGKIDTAKPENRSKPNEDKISSILPCYHKSSSYNRKPVIALHGRFVSGRSSRQEVNLQIRDKFTQPWRNLAALNLGVFMQAWKRQIVHKSLNCGLFWLWVWGWKNSFLLFNSIPVIAE